MMIFALLAHYCPYSPLVSLFQTLPGSMMEIVTLPSHNPVRNSLSATTPERIIRHSYLPGQFTSAGPPCFSTV